MSATDVERDGISRRDALKRGALIGGAVVWSIPAIQLIALTPAHAERPSGSAAPPPPPPPPHRSTPPSVSPPPSSTTPPTTPPAASSTPPPQVLGEKTTTTPSSGHALPFTGSEVGDYAALGSGVLAAGAGLTAAAIYGAHRKVRADGPADEPEAEPPAR